MGRVAKGSITQHGYRVYGSRKAREYEHRIIAAKVLGRSLKKSEEVHHVDRQGTNNGNGNLVICTRAFHKYLHFLERVHKLGVTRKDFIQWHVADGVPLEAIKRHLHLGEGMIGRWFKRMNIPITPGMSGAGSLKRRHVPMPLIKL